MISVRQHVAGQAAARLYAGGLTGHAAAILAMPGAETAQVKSLQAQIIAAGGAITGTFTTGDALVDADGRSSVHSSGCQVTAQGQELSLIHI